MNKRTIGAFAAALGLVAILMLSGCSGDDDKGTSSAKLTPEEQYELLAQFIDVDTATIGNTLAPLVIAQAGVGLWDGVDQEDFGDLDFGFGLLPGMISSAAKQHLPPSLGKSHSLLPADVDLPTLLAARAHQMVAEAATISIDYDLERGWWFADVDLSEDFDTTGASLSLSISIRDSIRFDNSTTGVPSPEPNSQTDRFRHGTSLAVQLTLNLGDAGNDVNIDFSVDGQSTATVLGLNSGSALVNGSTSLDLDMDAGGFVEDTETSETLAFDIAGSIDLSALVDDLMIPIDIEGEPGCPESGLVQAGLGVNLNVLFGDESGQAEGDWSISIEMLGQGVGHVEIQSGDFLIEGTTVVCDPLLPPIRR